MNIEELLNSYPLKRIKPSDGLAITAEVWEEAHEYHRHNHRYHTMLGHGPGILSGLEVIASDPPDTSIYISPGVAIDADGQPIVLPQAVAYDIGQEMEGLFYVILSYSESQPRSDETDEDNGSGPRYIHGEFSISAHATLAEVTGVELARVRRSSRDSVLRDVTSPMRPGLDEIDLRFRREIGAPPEIKVAISYLGQHADKRHGVGLAQLAQTLTHTGHYRLQVEDDVSIGPGLVTNTLVCLVGQGQFELTAAEMTGLRNYVYRGNGTLFIESLDEAAEKAFLNFLTSKDMKPAPVAGGHRLLTQPYLFNTPPPGYEPDNPPVEVSEGVIFSRRTYGRLWQGERRDQPASREEIRAATEWGSNLMTYALNRWRKLSK